MARQKRPSHPVLKNTVAGSMAGMASLLVCHPLDVVRTRLQTSARFRGAFDCARKTVVEEGVLALYKGMSGPLLAQGIYKAVMFGAYTTAQQAIRSFSGAPASQPLSIPQLFLCGAFAGGCNSFVVAPVELVRNRLIAQYTPLKVAAAAATAATGGGTQSVVASSADAASTPFYRGPIDCVRQVVQSDGIRGLWKGLGPTLVRDVPGVGAWYAGYEVTRKLLTGNLPASPLPAWKALTAGAMGGISFWLVAMPFDTVKSIVQTDLQGKYKNALDCVQQVVRKEGIRRLYRGLPVALTRGIPGAATVFYTQGLFMGWLNKLDW